MSNRLGSLRVIPFRTLRLTKLLRSLKRLIFLPQSAQSFFAEVRKDLAIPSLL